MNDFTQQINAALGCTLDHVSPDGRMRRFSTNGRASDKAGWYVMPSPDVVVAGCWRSGQTITLFADGKSKDDPEALEAIQRARKAYRLEREQSAKEASAKASKLLGYSKDFDVAHPYSHSKRINQMPWLRGKLRARMLKSSIVIDITNAYGELVGLQFIGQDGDKKFLTGTAKSAAWHWLLNGDMRPGDIIGLCEGWATGCAVAQMRGLSQVAVAFDAGNLAKVAKRLLALYPHNPIVIFADDDDVNQKTGKKAGQAGAEAARAIDPQCIGIEYPAWADGKKPAGASDFNDLFIDGLRQA